MDNGNGLRDLGIGRSVGKGLGSPLTAGARKVVGSGGCASGRRGEVVLGGHLAGVGVGVSGEKGESIFQG